MMNSLQDLIKLANTFYNYLISHGMDFTEEGYPIFRENMFLDEYPNQVVPYSFRNDISIDDKNKTVLCHFTADKYIYPRLDKLLKEVDLYREFMGVISTDITVTADMDTEWQKMTVLLNQLYMAVLAINNIKVIANTRIGNSDMLYCFNGIPKNVLCASSFLGCSSNNTIYDNTYMKKIMYILPSKLIIYGKCDMQTKEALNTLGVNYRVYDDFHTASKKRRKIHE